MAAKSKDAPSVHYVKNAAGGVQIVSDEHFTYYLLTSYDEAGTAHLKPGYSELTAAEARKTNPQLFGALDPQIRYTPKELVAKAEYAKQLAALKATNATAETEEKA
ncbi:MAG: hypothetical protein LKJ05_02790 [Bifidobacteriaceae bacterium]|jgi:hypothetical protein|nr:hypothetical protein [Bifidobacteriaceae bacterium]